MLDLLPFLGNPTFWVSLSTLFVVGLLIKLLTPIITSALDKRSGEIGEELDRAMALREEAQVVLAQYQKKQRESLKEAEEILQKANLEARRITREAEQEVEDQLKKRVKLAMDKIEQAERSALQEVQGRVIEMTVIAARAIVTDKLTDNAHAELIDTATQDVKNKLH